MALSIAIFAKQETPAAISLAEEIAALVESAAQTVWFDPLTAVAIDRHPTPLDEFAAADLIVSVGGDGTFLFAAATAGSTPIVGVNLGEVGFLNAVDPADAVVTVQRLLEELRAGDPLPIRHLDRLAVTGAAVDPAINEIVIQAPTRGAAAPLTLTIDVDEERYLRTEADGVMVATSTGSSAYNLSEDGPLIHPAVPAMVVTTMADRAHHPAMVLPTTAAVQIAVEGPPEAVVVSDGRTRTAVALPQTVTVARHGTSVALVEPTPHYFDALEKLA
ncbi:MAG: NAD(+)/NADH kinase [Haloquadratum sp.]|jgi:NAD+ kinase|nr:NAD(+)/NADH kinase [Haloquadratum sp.]